MPHLLQVFALSHEEEGRSAVVAPARQGDSSVSPAMTVKAFHQVRGTFAGPQVDLRRSAVCVFDDAQAIRGDGSQDPPEGQRSSDLLARVAARQTDKFARQGRGNCVLCVCGPTIVIRNEYTPIFQSQSLQLVQAL